MDTKIKVTKKQINSFIEALLKAGYSYNRVEMYVTLSIEIYLNWTYEVISFYSSSNNYYETHSKMNSKEDGINTMLQTYIYNSLPPDIMSAYESKSVEKEIKYIKKTIDLELTMLHRAMKQNSISKIELSKQRLEELRKQLFVLEG